MTDKIEVETNVDGVLKFRMEVLSDNVVNMLKHIMKDDPNYARFDPHNADDSNLLMEASLACAMIYIDRSGLRFTQLFELVYEHYVAYAVWHIAQAGIYTVTLDDNGEDFITVKEGTDDQQT